MLSVAVATGSAGGLQRGRALSSAEILREIGIAKSSEGASTGPRSFERGDCSNKKLIFCSMGCFNGAALFRARRFATIPTGIAPALPCFNGAALFRARRYPNSVRAYRHSMRLQRGRALSSAEIQGRCPLHPVYRPASTGPRSFERGDSMPPPRWLLPRQGFNGAALFRARRSATSAICTRTEYSCFNGAALFRARRSRAGVTTGSSSTLLQRGRALSSAEIVAATVLAHPADVLQRGRALSSAEIIYLVRGPDDYDGASTGPRSFERGDDPFR